MECLKIVLTQSRACYKKPETVSNAMTYPLPPFHTVIGAIHSACGWKEYHSMNVSVQGKYAYMGSRMYTSDVPFNSVQRDRGYFAKMAAPCAISNSRSVIAKVINGYEGRRNFMTCEGFIILRPDLLQEYNDLIKKIQSLSKEMQELRTKRSSLNKSEKKEIDVHIKELKNEYDSLKTQKDMFYSFERIPAKEEVLRDVELTIHIESKYNAEILDNIYNLKAIGKSEDSVDIVSAKIVTCDTAPAGSATSNPMYINRHACKNLKDRNGNPVRGTVYYLNKYYEIVDKKRKFEKVKCLYTSNVIVDSESDDILIDDDGTVFNLN